MASFQNYAIRISNIIKIKSICVQKCQILKGILIYRSGNALAPIHSITEQSEALYRKQEQEIDISIPFEITLSMFGICCCFENSWLFLFRYQIQERETPKIDNGS